MSSERPVVVVGVDGSSESIEALCWAVGYARRTGGTVRAVIAWQHQIHPYSSYAGVAMVFPETLDFEEEARESLRGLVTDVVGKSECPPIQQLVLEGHPAALLVEESKSADLLAVGARGHGAFTDLLIGSVSNHCVHHAACPVLVVRRHEELSPPVPTSDHDASLETLSL
jgi:nucleotide-binding universal stress UspA family protein